MKNSTQTKEAVIEKLMNDSATKNDFLKQNSISSHIKNIEVTTDDDNTLCVKFKIDGVEWLEWINIIDGINHIEYTDSHLKCHYEGDLDVDEILEYLDSKI